jgi:hypothetical protein
VPVVGHVWIGWATAVLVPRPASRPEVWRVWWIPALIALAYAPDIAGNLLHAAGVAHGRAISHSAPFALVCAGAIAAAWHRSGGTAWRAFLLTLASVWLHDLADLMQGSPTAAWWPVPAGRDYLAFILPDRIRGEVLVFGTMWVVVALVSGALRGRSTGTRRALREFVPGGAGWIGLMLVLGIAVALNSTRGRRERDLREAARLNAAGRHVRALEALDRADKWPRFGRPGRIEYLRGEAYAQMGDVERAEMYYRRVIEADPDYIWAIADLALLYASSEDDIATRRRRVEPLVERMKRDFADHRALNRLLQRIERELGTGSGHRGATTK